MFLYHFSEGRCKNGAKFAHAGTDAHAGTSRRCGKQLCGVGEQCSSHDRNEEFAHQRENYAPNWPLYIERNIIFLLKLNEMLN